MQGAQVQSLELLKIIANTSIIDLPPRFLVKILDGIVALFKEDDSILEIIQEETVNNLKNEMSKSLVRCNLSYVAKMLEALTVLPFDGEKDSILYGQIEWFILLYLDTTGRVIIADDLESILELTNKVLQVDSKYFSEALIHKFEDLFLKGSIPNEIGFSIGNIQKMFESFEEINQYQDREKVVQRVQECYLEYNDADDDGWLKLLLHFEKSETITAEVLGFTIYYVIERFNHMKAEHLSEFLWFLSCNGLYQPDKMNDLLSVYLNNHFSTLKPDELIEIFHGVSYIGWVI